VHQVVFIYKIPFSNINVASQFVFVVRVYCRQAVTHLG